MIHLRELSGKLAIIALICLGGNYIATGVSPIHALPGMAALLLIVLIGLAADKILHIKSIPVIIFISLAGVMSTAPFMPWSHFIVPLIEKVSNSSLATPILCLAGISAADELSKITSMGIRMSVVAISVLTGTFICSALIAEMILRILHI
ncbi:MAG: hypothetical protein AB9903_32840 [Vulcanimicrobiota bacterium]